MKNNKPPQRYCPFILIIILFEQFINYNVRRLIYLLINNTKLDNDYTICKHLLTHTDVAIYIKRNYCMHIKELHHIVHDTFINNNLHAQQVLYKMHQNFDLSYHITRMFHQTCDVSNIQVYINVLPEDDKIKTIFYMLNHQYHDDSYIRKLSYIISTNIGIQRFVYNCIMYRSKDKQMTKIYTDDVLIRINKYCKQNDGIHSICKKYVMVDLDSTNLKVTLETLLLILKTGLVNTNLQYILRRAIIPFVLQL